MNVIQTLAQALTQEKDFKPLEQLALPDVSPLAGDAFDFVALRTYWGSVTSIAFARGDGLTEAQIKDKCERFFRITEAMTNHTGALQISTAFSTRAVKLASYGILCFVFEGGCPEDRVAFVQKQKRGNFSKKEYALFWVVDVKTGRVYSHRWLPFGVFPGRKYLESALRRQGRGEASARKAA